jgi:putative membrane protein
MLMSEWPKGGTRGQGGWRRLLDGWTGTGMGVLTFVLAGLLGFILMYRSPVSPEVAFQNLMPAFVGLFTLPWLLMNLASRVAIPPQRVERGLRLGGAPALHGLVAGTLGGGFADSSPATRPRSATTAPSWCRRAPPRRSTTSARSC